MANTNIDVHAVKTGNSVIHINVAESQNYLTASATVNVSVDMARNFNITASIYPADSATVSGTGTVKEGNSITVTANPVDGYRFVGWKVNGETVSTSNSYTFTPDSDTELVATCEVIPVYTITVVSDPENGSDIDTEYTAREGTTQTINQTPNDGYRFVGWKVNGETVSTSNSYTFEVTSDITITAVYEEIPVYTISATVEPEDWGTVTGTGEYLEGSTCTLTATNVSGYKFSEWQEDGNTLSTDETYTFTVTGDLSVTAVFAKFSRLPEGYTEVEYIQSDSKCFIDTGVYPQSNVTGGGGKVCDTNTELDIEPLEAPTSTSKYMVYSSGPISSVTVYYYISWKTTKGAYAYLSTGSSSNTAVGPVTDKSLRRMKVYLDAVNRTFYVDGESISTGPTRNISSTHSTIKLFSTISSASNSLKAKLYSCKIYKGDNLPLVREFVPCVNPSGEVGLYDLADSSFYGNSGTGAFTAGPAV